MIVIEKNVGTKIDYSVSKTKITFADELMINLTKLEKDWPVHKDICMDADGDLTMGTGAGLYYVAEVDIPAREYQEPDPAEEGEETGERIPLPLDMDKVTLTLWALEKPVEADEEMED